MIQISNVNLCNGLLSNSIVIFCIEIIEPKLCIFKRGIQILIIGSYKECFIEVTKILKTQSRFTLFVGKLLLRKVEISDDDKFCVYWKIKITEIRNI